MHELETWRSLLFVPAHVERFVEKAHARGSDAIVLDLEDSVPAERKDDARNSTRAAAVMLAGQGQRVLVRINAEREMATADLEAAVGHAVSGVVVPKAESVDQLAYIDRRIGEIESAKGLPQGRIACIAQIESVQALRLVDEIARAPRIAGLNLGTEDFCASIGAEPSTEALLYPSQTVLFAARRAGIVPLGFAGYIGEYTDIGAFRRTIRQARGLGFRGAFCVHPDQVPILNEEFAPGKAEIEEAEALIRAYEAAAAQGRGAVSFRGRMIDAPVVVRAKALVSMKRGG